MARRSRRSSTSILDGFNLADLAEGMARPGNDPRTWVSFGTVGGGTTDDDPCVEFENDQPRVRVVLHPSFREVRARVAMAVAGDGEAQWHPFMPGDEVLVVLPEGNERAGATIIGKLCNSIDKFPSGSVAGQDPRKNNFAFRRTKTPVVEELHGPVLHRSAATGGFLSIDEAGVLTLRGGNPDDPDSKKPAPGLQLSADGVSLQDASTKYALSFGPTSGAFLLLVDDAVLSLSSTAGGQPSMIGVPTSLAIGTNGNPPLEHAASIEGVVSVLNAFLTVMGNAFTLIPPSVGGAPGGAPFGAVITALATSGWASAYSIAGALSPVALAALQGAIAAQGQKPNTPTGQLAPGVCAPGLLIG